MLFLHATYMLPALYIRFFQLLALIEIQISSDDLTFLANLSSGDLYLSCGHRLKKCPYYSSWLVSNYSSSLLPKIFFLWLSSHWIVSSTLLLSPKSPLSYFSLFFDDLYFLLKIINPDCLPIDLKTHLDDTSNTLTSYFLGLLSFDNLLHLTLTWVSDISWNLALTITEISS